MQEMKTTILKGIALRLDEKDRDFVLYTKALIYKGTFFHSFHSFLHW